MLASCICPCLIPRHNRITTQNTDLISLLCIVRGGLWTMAVRFVPATVPRARRLQTLCVALWALTLPITYCFFIYLWCVLCLLLDILSVTLTRPLVSYARVFMKSSHVYHLAWRRVTANLGEFNQPTRQIDW